MESIKFCLLLCLALASIDRAELSSLAVPAYESLTEPVATSNSASGVLVEQADPANIDRYELSSLAVPAYESLAEPVATSNSASGVLVEQADAASIDREELSISASGVLVEQDDHAVNHSTRLIARNGTAGHRLVYNFNGNPRYNSVRLKGHYSAFGSASALNCWASCDTSPSCTAMTYDERDRVCYFFTSSSLHTACKQTGWTTIAYAYMDILAKFRRDHFYGVRLFNHHYAYNTYQSAETCFNDCLKSSICSAITFSPEGYCYFYSHDAYQARLESGWTSIADEGENVLGHL